MALFTVTNLFDFGAGSLRDAINMANFTAGADTIEFNNSLSGGTIGLTSGQLSITNPLTINGLGANFLTVNAGNHGFRVFNIDDGTSSLINVFINGLTITGGNPKGDGGGIRNLEKLTVQNSVISGNSAVGILGTYENFDGGGIDSRNGDLEIFNSIISGNQVIGQKEDDDDTDGGGVSIRDGQLKVINSTISQNQAWGGLTDGGGIYSWQSEVIVINSTISGNKVEGNDLGSGGGIYNRYGNTTVTDSTIADNSTLMTGDFGSGDGGGIFSRNGNLTVTDSTISGNSAVGVDRTDGGGIYSRNGNLTVTNSTISHNSTAGLNADGGGIFSDDGTLTVTNSTLSNNSASALGSGLFNGDTANLTNTIIANSVRGADCINSGTLATNTNNLIEDGSCNPFKSGDPNLGPLKNNGGATATHALLPGSIAIDMGNNAGAAGLVFDQRGPGFDRIVNGAVDIGSYEYVPEPLTILGVGTAAMFGAIFKRKLANLKKTQKDNDMMKIY